MHGGHPLAQVVGGVADRVQVGGLGLADGREVGGLGDLSGPEDPDVEGGVRHDGHLSVRGFQWRARVGDQARP